MTIQFGTVSHGTLRTVDLLTAFADELERALDSEHSTSPRYRQRIQEARNARFPEQASWELENLRCCLEELAPSYAYFGAHPGDGSDFGFWPDIEALEDAVTNGEVIKVNDLADIPPEYEGEVMLVNDHGNVTYGTINNDGNGGNFIATWSCV